MSRYKWIGVVLIVLGGLGLGYGSFSYTEQTHKAQIGPLALSVSEHRTVNIPLWASGVAIAIGLLMLVAAGGRKS